MNDDLTEARAILADLSAISDRFKVLDQRFVESWRHYLDRTGAGARIGKTRGRYKAGD